MRSRTLDAVVSDLEAREQQGLITYGCTVDRVDLARTDWVRHAYHEALDLAMYLRRVQMEDNNDVADDCNDGGGAVDRAHGAGDVPARGTVRSQVTIDYPAGLLTAGAAAAVYLAMRTLMQDGDTVTVSGRQIATMVDMSPVTVERQIGVLVQRGYVERIEGEHRNSRSTYRIR